MSAKPVRLTRCFASAAAALAAMVAVFGCNVSSTGSPRTSSRASASDTQVISVAENDDPGIDLQCAADRIRNAASPFHWSYIKTVSPGSTANWEADITHDSIVGVFIDISGARAIHGFRSDATSWNTAASRLISPLPMSTFALVTHSSATMRFGAGNMNGESAIEYAIDTSRNTAPDASLIRSVLGANGFVKGTAWVTRRGCPVNFVLDVEQHNNDGAVQKEHYEANARRN